MCNSMTLTSIENVTYYQELVNRPTGNIILWVNGLRINFLILILLDTAVWILFWRLRPETLLLAVRNLTQRAADTCWDVNKAAPRSYRQPVGHADSRVHGAESSAAEHRAEPVKLLQRLFLLFGCKAQKQNNRDYFRLWFDSRDNVLSLNLFPSPETKQSSGLICNDILHIWVLK